MISLVSKPGLTFAALKLFVFAEFEDLLGRCSRSLQETCDCIQGGYYLTRHFYFSHV